jgi:6-phosphofructokinase 1
MSETPTTTDNKAPNQAEKKVKRPKIRNIRPLPPCSQSWLWKKEVTVTGQKRIGLLTGGGDAPALNAVIRAITTKGCQNGWEIIGFLDGWAGVLHDRWITLTPEKVRQIHQKGGSILFSSRTPIFPKKPGAEDRSPQAIKTLTDLKIHALIGIGGDDTLSELLKLHQGPFQKVVGVPKTIDNDVGETDYTFGFETAAERVAEALERLHTTAHAHHRVIVAEIMGRHAGWMALEGGLAAGAHYIALPETGIDLTKIEEIIIKRYKEPNPNEWYVILAIAEGANSPELTVWLSEAQKAVLEACQQAGIPEKLIKRVIKIPDLDPFGHVYLAKVGLAETLVKYLEERLASKIKAIRPEITKFECRPVILGHLQRAGPPSAFDRNLGLRLGLFATQLVEKEQWGQMAALKGTKIVAVDLKKALIAAKKVPPKRSQEAETFFGL